MPLKLLSFRAVDSAGVQFMMCELSDICYPTVPVDRYVSGAGLAVELGGCGGGGGEPSGPWLSESPCSSEESVGSYSSN